MQTNELIIDVAKMDLTDITKPASSESSNGICAHCFSPATQTCNGCVDAPIVENVQSFKTFYCDATCQKADWTNHKKVCKSLSARKRLYRAGDIVQRIFYVYREQAFEKLITKVEKEDDTLYLYEGQYGEEALVPFPNHLFHCTDDREAALTYYACSDAVAFMLEITRNFLKGMCSNLEEVTMNLRQTPRKTYVVDKYRNHDKTMFPHVIFRVRLHSEELYAFDLSGAQYGYRETVVPWARYERTRLSNASNKIITINPSGSYSTTLQAAIQGSSLHDVIMRYNVILSEETFSACGEFVKKEGKQPLREMCKFEQMIFEGKRDRLVTHVSKALVDFNADWKKNGGMFKVVESGHPDSAGAFIAQLASWNVNNHYD